MHQGARLPAVLQHQEDHQRVEGHLLHLCDHHHLVGPPSSCQVGGHHQDQGVVP